MAKAAGGWAEETVVLQNIKKIWRNEVAGKNRRGETNIKTQIWTHWINSTLHNTDVTAVRKEKQWSML